MDILKNSWILDEDDFKELQKRYIEVEANYFDSYWDWEYRQQILEMSELYDFLEEKWKIDEVLNLPDSD